MTEDRIHSLNEFSFDWVNQVSWEERRDQLAEYKKEIGETNVPIHYAKNKQLGTWVQTQRMQYKLFKEGKSNFMTEDRIISLNELGFNWGKQKGSQVSWEKRREQLAEYKEMLEIPMFPIDMQRINNLVSEFVLRELNTSNF